MRTSIILDDELGAQLREAAKAKGVSLSAFLAAAGREKLGGAQQTEAEPFELVVRGGDGPQSGIDLDRTSELLAAEDLETYGK